MFSRWRERRAAEKLPLPESAFVADLESYHHWAFRTPVAVALDARRAAPCAALADADRAAVAAAVAARFAGVDAHHAYDVRCVDVAPHAGDVQLLLDVEPPFFHPQTADLDDAKFAAAGDAALAAATADGTLAADIVARAGAAPAAPDAKCDARDRAEISNGVFGVAAPQACPSPTP